METIILSKEDWEGNMAADEQAQEGTKKSEPPQQMVSEYVRRRHMIQNARWHILEWRDNNLDIAPEVKIDGDAGGGEGARQAQAELLYKCKKTEEMKDSRVRNHAGRWMSSKKKREHTHETLNASADTEGR